jgi:hypothetical protein
VRFSSDQQREFIDRNQAGEQNGINPPSEQDAATEPKWTPCQPSDECPQQYALGAGGAFGCESVWLGDPPIAFLANNVQIRTPTDGPGQYQAWGQYAQSIRALTVSANTAGNTMQITYGDYTKTVTGVFDVGADITNPAEIKVYLHCCGYCGRSSGRLFHQVEFFG